MNIDTGELIRFDELTRQQVEGFLRNDRFVQVPEDLEDCADKELGNNNSTIVDMSKDTPLTRWAHSERNKRKHKHKIAKNSKRNNRK